MKKKLLIICGITAMLLAGCTKSTIISGSLEEPVFETQEGIVLDWTQIWTDLEDIFLDESDYPMAVSLNYNVDPEKNYVGLVLMVKEGTTPEEAVEYANEVVRGVNDEASTQDFSFEASTQTSYGGFFKKNDLNIVVMPDGAMSDESLWLVNMTIPAGSDEEIVPIEGAKAMETTAE